MKLKDVVKKLESSSMKKNFYNLLIILLIGILILLVSSFFNNDKSVSTSAGSTSSDDTNVISQDETTQALNSYEENQKEQLKKILSSIDGVGEVNVMLTLESSPEKVPAVDINKSTTNTNEKDNSGGTRENVQQNNGSTVVMSNQGEGNAPLILKILNPKVNGVVVVAEGGNDKALEYKIIKTVSTLYNIPEHKVSVFPMKK